MKRFQKIQITLAAGAVLAIGMLPLAGQRNGELRDIYMGGPMAFRVPDAVMQAKSALESGNDKIDPQLRELLNGPASKSIGELSEAAKDLGIPFEANRVAVTLMAEDQRGADDLADKVRNSGGEVTGRVANAVYALVPVNAVEQIGKADELHYLMRQATYTPDVMLMAPPQGSGRVISEGVEVIKARLMHERGITGKGVKVGIIDFGFQKYSQLMANGQVPRPAAMQAFNTQGQMEVDTVHGTACAEIIHAMAPDAQIYLAAINGREDQLVQAANWMLQQGVHIISFSGGTPVGPLNGKSLMDLLVNQTVQRGVFWVNAAGNEGEKHWGGVAADRNGDGWLDIGADGSNFIAFKTRVAQTQIVVTWDDWGPTPTKPTATQDIDAYLFSYNPQTKQTQLVARSVNPQQGRGAPLEAVGGKTEVGQIFLLALKATNVTRPVRVHVYPRAFEEMYPSTPVGSIAIPGTSPGALTVGAVDVRNSQLEKFSSQGPTDDGRMKPEVVAPDNNRSVAYEGSQANGRFPGTSAACPHTSGFAALLKQANMSADVQQMRRLVTTWVRPIGNPVPNNQYGFGHILARIDGDGNTGNPGGGSSMPGGRINLPGAWGGPVSSSMLDRLLDRGRPDRLNVQLVVGKETYTVGDGMKIGYKASEDCHCLMLHRDIRGKYTVIAPREGDRSLQLEGNAKYTMPNGREVIRVTGPAGREEIVLVCSREPENLSNWQGGDDISVAVARYDVKE